MPWALYEHLCPLYELAIEIVSSKPLVNELDVYAGLEIWTWGDGALRVQL